MSCRYSDTPDGTIVEYNKKVFETIPSISSLGRGSLAWSENVNLRRDGGESFTSTDSDSLRLTDHVGYPTPMFKYTDLGFYACQVATAWPTQFCVRSRPQRVIGHKFNPMAQK